MLRLGCEQIGSRRIIAAGFPTVYKDVRYLNGCKVVRVFLQSTHDQYGPLADLTKLVATLPEPKQLIAIPAGDHFFSGGLDRLEEAIMRLQD